MVKRRKIANIISLAVLLLVLLTSYYIRHIVVEDECLDMPTITTEYCIAATQRYDWDNARQLQLIVIAPIFCCVFMLLSMFACNLALVRCLHNHGRCSRKIIKAIILQFHPD